MQVHDHHGGRKSHGESHIGSYSVCPDVTYVTSTHISESKPSPGQHLILKGEVLPCAREMES